MGLASICIYLFVHKRYNFISFMKLAQMQLKSLVSTSVKFVVYDEESAGYSVQLNRIQFKFDVSRIEVHPTFKNVWRFPNHDYTYLMKDKRRNGFAQWSSLSTVPEFEMGLLIVLFFSDHYLYGELTASRWFKIPVLLIAPDSQWRRKATTSSFPETMQTSNFKLDCDLGLFKRPSKCSFGSS